MGTLTLPASGEIYLDANMVIYAVEKIEPYASFLAPHDPGDPADLGRSDEITQSRSQNARRTSRRHCASLQLFPIFDE